MLRPVTDQAHDHEHLTPRVRAALDRMLDEASRIEESLAAPEVSGDFRRSRELGIRKGALAPAVWAYREVLEAEREEEDLRAAIEQGGAGADAESREFAELARAELPGVQRRIRDASARAIEALVSSDEAKVGAAMLELRAGVGGDEAALWAGDLLRMYEQFAQRRGWRVETIDLSEGPTGGVKSAVLAVRGEGVWEALAHEAGTHCVKRVPATETQGRIHTSTATVAALPEPEEVDLKIDPADVVEHVTTAQGPGGQNVNKVATAVHLVHTPTGVEVRMQESKSQRQNREKAWRLLRARLYEIELEKARASRNAARASQIGGAERSERIRTYRFKESIVVDHRLERQFNLGEVLDGGLDALVEGLRRREIERRIVEI